MEVAGLILGVAGIIVPAYQAIQSLTNRISATKNFSRKLRTLNGQIALQKKLFDNECILLFSGEFDESLVRKMLIDADHRKWRDTEFQAKFVAHLGDFFGQSVEPFRIIRETVETLESEVVKVTVEGGAKTGSVPNFKGLYRKLQRPSESPRLDQLLLELRVQIIDLLNLRKQRETAQKRKYRSKELKTTIAAQELTDRLPAVMAVQKASKMVFAAISSVATCKCHRFYFQLQYETPASSPAEYEEITAARDKGLAPAETSIFKLVLTTSPEDNINKFCACLAVRKDASPTPTHINLPHTPPPPYSHRRTSSTKPIKKLQFDIATPPDEDTLTDLCQTLSHHPSPPSYLGSLPSTDPHRHIYSLPAPTPNSHLSLPSIFARIPLSRTRSILPPTRRYRLAWTLSASLLRFGFSTNFISSHWRTRDIFFLHGPDTLEFPHISVRFLDASSSSGTCLAKNEQLYSLAIALIEIAYGDTLQNLLQENGVVGGEWNHAKEYSGARELAERVGEVMSRRYAMVVRRCFWCDFAIEEEQMTSARLQRAYYEKVECELRACMVEFSGRG